MATIYPPGYGSRVKLCVQGTRDSATFPTRAQAKLWGQQREGELSGRKLAPMRFLDALRSYAREEAPKHKGAKWELVRLRSLERDGLAKRKLATIDADDFATWRDDRLQEVSPGTVAREMNLIRSVLEFARKPPRRWIRANPMQDVDWPTTPAGRRRRVMPDEVSAVRLAFGLGKGYPTATQTNRVGLAFLFSLETAMRSGEICALQPKDVQLAQRFVVLPATKNGDRREVPLSSTACAILRALSERDEDQVFELEDQMRDALWRKSRPASLADLHFHDARGEAIWRLSKKLDVLQLAQVIGHRDLTSLMHYYRESAADMASRLG
jgi:integrase